MILSPGSALIIDSDMLVPGATGPEIWQAQPRGSLSRVERAHIQKTLDETGWVIEGPKGAARVLDMHPNTLRSRMKKLGIVRTTARLLVTRVTRPEFILFWECDTMQRSIVWFIAGLVWVGGVEGRAPIAIAADCVVRRPRRGCLRRAPGSVTISANGACSRSSHLWSRRSCKAWRSEPISA